MANPTCPTCEQPKAECASCGDEDFGRHVRSVGEFFCDSCLCPRCHHGLLDHLPHCKLGGDCDAREAA